MRKILGFYVAALAVSLAVAVVSFANVADAVQLEAGHPHVRPVSHGARYRDLVGVMVSNLA